MLSLQAYTLLKQQDIDASLLANGNTAFLWNLCCHWLNVLHFACCFSETGSLHICQLKSSLSQHHNYHHHHQFFLSTSYICIIYIDGLVEDWSNSIANAQGLLQPCTKPSIYIYTYTHAHTHTYIYIHTRDLNLVITVPADVIVSMVTPIPMIHHIYIRSVIWGLYLQDWCEQCHQITLTATHQR